MTVPKVSTAHLRFLALTDFASQHCGERYGSGKDKEYVKRKRWKRPHPDGRFSIGFALLMNITEIG